MPTRSPSYCLLAMVWSPASQSPGDQSNDLICLAFAASLRARSRRFHDSLASAFAAAFVAGCAALALGGRDTAFAAAFAATLVAGRAALRRACVILSCPGEGLLDGAQAEQTAECADRQSLADLPP